MEYAKEENGQSLIDAPSFSVQSEKELWWLGAFEVPKKTHEVLKHMFSRLDKTYANFLMSLPNCS